MPDGVVNAVKALEDVPILQQHLEADLDDGQATASVTTLRLSCPPAPPFHTRGPHLVSSDYI